MALTLRAVLDELDRLSRRGRDRRDRPRRDRRLRRARRAARRPRQLRRHPLPADPRRRRGARLPARRARRPGAGRRRDGARGRPRLRLRARAGRGHDPHRRARDGAPRGLRARAHARAAPGRRRTAPSGRTRCSPRCSSARSTRARAPSAAARTCCPSCARPGVVDAGGFGLTVIFAGVVAALRGTEAPELDHHAPARVTHPQHESSTFRYCTNFAVTGESLEPTAWIDALEAIGDSVLVVGDQRTLKVHVHTDEPERATALFAGVGRRLAPRRRRHARAGRAAHGAARASRARCGVVAVVSGHGMEELFQLARRHAAAGRPDAQPVDLRAARRHPRRARRGGRRAAQLAQRGHGRRARRRAVGEEGRRRAHALPAGGPLGGGRARRRPRRARPTPPRCTTRWPPCAPAP